MDQHSSQLDNTAAASKSATSNTIDFNTVIDLKEYAGKNAKFEIDSTVNERNMPGKSGHELITEKEKVRITENGKPLSEHVLNDLTLTNNAHGSNLKDKTFIAADEKDVLAKVQLNLSGHGENHAEGHTEKHAEEHAEKHAEIHDEDRAEKFNKAGMNEPSMHKEEKSGNEQAVKKNSLPELTLFDSKK
ncbi:MAG: hypothetical protein KGS72_00180 [Cyanobacteria bacterium REEB67]|nr:hypothetical protein [Cyanobacteria bacterium REEB67]